MSSEDFFFLTEKGRQARTRFPEEGLDPTSENLEFLVRRPDLGIIALLAQYEPMTGQELMDWLVKTHEYQDPFSREWKKVEVSPAEVRQGIRRLYEAGLVDRSEQ